MSIPDTPERNESINTTTFVADNWPDRHVDLSVSTYSVCRNGNNNPITDASITIKILIQDHVNRHTQTLIDNPPDTQTYNPQGQINQLNIETINPQDHLNQPDIQINNQQDQLNQPDIQTNKPRTNSNSN